MSIKNKLQIILITYNREKHVKKTFEQLFAENSPIKDYELLVLDNNSTDGTEKFVKQFRQQHKNIKYSKNRYNVGLSGNIAKAMEIADKEYVWIICDDDNYDFSNWSEVESAIENEEDAICVARYALSDENKDKVESQLSQMAFVPAIILKTSVLSDTIMRNVFDNVYTLFPHICPLVSLINHNKSIYVVDKAIVDNGMVVDETDVSYTRGTESSELYPKVSKMSWISGYANICSALKDEGLRQKAMTVAINSKDIHNGFDNFCASMYIWYFIGGNWSLLMDVFSQLSPVQRTILLKSFMQIMAARNQEHPNLIQKLGVLESTIYDILDLKFNL